MFFIIHFHVSFELFKWTITFLKVIPNVTSFPCAFFVFCCLSKLWAVQTRWLRAASASQHLGSSSVLLCWASDSGASVAQQKARLQAPKG